MQMPHSLGVGLIGVLAAVCVSRAAAEERFDCYRSVVYATRGEDKLRADVYVPKGNKTYPGVLLVHGGGWIVGNKSRMNFLGEKLAERGYVAMSINYRLAPAFKFPAQIEDCRTAVAWLRAHAADYKLDPTRIAAFGYSAGGQLVALLGTSASHQKDGDPKGDPKKDADSRVQAVIAGGAPCDFRSLPPDSLRLAYWLGNSRSEAEDLYRQASPTHYVSSDDPPVFFYHGGNDTLVPIRDPQAMQAALKKANVETDFYVVPKAGHMQTFFDDEAFEKACAFLDKVFHTDASTEAKGASPSSG
jgi:acetyl esterase/lipase